MTYIEALDEAMAKAACAAQLGSHVWDAFSDSSRNDWLKSAGSHRTTLLSHLAAMGWQVVPKVATEAMVDAAVSTFIRENGGIEHAPFVTWGAMIEAAPKIGGSDAARN